MFISATRKGVAILTLLCATALAMADDAKMIPYFSSKRTPSLKIRNAVLEGIRTEFPKAVKVFEFHDEGNSFVLLKLSENSYTCTSFDPHSNSVAEFQFDEKNLRMIPTKSERKVSGNFKYQEIDPANGTLMTITHNWTIFVRELDLKDTNEVLFYYQCGANKEHGLIAKKITIAVDWKAGRVEGVKVVALTGKDNGLEP